MKKQNSIRAGLDLKENPYLIKKCKYCGAEIVWLKSKTGKSYPVNFIGVADVIKTDFHKCINNKKPEPEKT